MTCKSDDELAMEYLAGVIEERGAHVSASFLKPNSASEQEARKALVRLLRNGFQLSDAIRWRIAALLDVDHPYESRKLVIVNRAHSTQPNHTRDFLIARQIAVELAGGRHLEEIYRDVEDRYSVSRSTVQRVWADARGSSLTKDPRSIN